MTTIAEHLKALKNDLRDCKKAIAWRGGTISATAGFQEIARGVSAIPTNISIGTFIDDSVAVAKSVPEKSTKCCYINSIGGMTYKVADTFVATVTDVVDEDYRKRVSVEFEYIPSIPFMLPTGENNRYFFQPFINGYPTAFNSSIDKLIVNGTIECNGMQIPQDVLIQSISGTLTANDVDPNLYNVGQQWICTPSFFNYYSGMSDDYFYPPSPLRDTKVTAIKSYKADGSLIAEYALPQALIEAQTGKGIGDYFDTIDLENGKIVTKTKTVKLGDVTMNQIMNAYGSENKYISDTGFVGVQYTAINDFVLSRGSIVLCDFLPAKEEWQPAYIGVKLTTMTSTGVHYLTISFPYNWAGIELTDGYSLIQSKASAWVKSSGITVTYALEVPTESELDTEFIPIIEVEEGGSIEFVSEYGYAVPSTVTFQTIN